MRRRRTSPSSIIAALIIFGVGVAAVVTTKNVVHAALYLVLVLAGVAAQYILLAAEFIAITQVLVYIGAIVVLFLFGIMLTRAKTRALDDDLDNRARARVGAVIVVAPCSASWAAPSGTASRDVGDVRRTYVVQTHGRGQRLHLLHLPVPFEVISVLLLAALIGAIVLARRD